MALSLWFGVVGSSPAVGNNFSFCNLGFRSLKLKLANAIEIIDIHLANTLF